MQKTDMLKSSTTVHGREPEACPFRDRIPSSRRYMCKAVDEICTVYVRRTEVDYKSCEIYQSGEAGWSAPNAE